MADRYGHPHHHHQHHSDEYDGDQPPPPFPPPSFRPDFPSYDDRPPPPPPPRFSSYDDQPPPPPPSFSSYENQPPPFRPPEHVSGGYQSSGSHYAPAPDSSHGYPHQHQEAAHHVSDEPDDGGEERHRIRPHVPAFVESHIEGHGHQSEGGSGPDLSSKPSVKVYCQADTNHMLAIRDGKVILARSDPNDPTQHWVKDERYSTKVKDQDRYPSFALVNKATGQALKHSIGATHPVQLIAYNPDVLDESVLWTMGKDLGGEYRQIRMVNNTRLVFDAFNGDKKHGGVHDGTTVVLWEPGKGDNQRWHITPYCKSLSLNRVCHISLHLLRCLCWLFPRVRQHCHRAARACLCGHE